MKNKYEIISHFLFPKFTQAKESRFINFFSSLSYKKKYNYHLNQYSISLEKIENGEDKRTSVIIKKIPNNLTKENMKQILEGIGNINYLYLPFDKVINRNLGFAYVNVVNYKNIINLYHRLKEYKFDNMELNQQMEVYYSKVQGKNSLSNLFAKK